MNDQPGSSAHNVVRTTIYALVAVGASEGDGRVTFALGEVLDLQAQAAIGGDGKLAAVLEGNLHRGFSGWIVEPHHLIHGFVAVGLKNKVVVFFRHGARVGVEPWG